MATESLERGLVPALEQLASFWTFRRAKWVEEIRRQVRASETQTARLVQQHEELVAQLTARQDALQGQNQALQATHAAVAREYRSMAEVLGLNGNMALGDRGPLLAAVRQVLNRQALVRELLRARPSEGSLAATSFQHWMRTRLEPALARLPLKADEFARALEMASKVEHAVAMQTGSETVQHKFVVAVAGGFSSGKSSFIASLMKDRAIELPTGVEPVTSIPTYVVSGTEQSIRAHTFRGGAVPISKGLYKAMTHDFIRSLGFNLRDILPYVTIQTPLRELHHVALLDLPGYDAAASQGSYTGADAGISQAFLKEANAVIWLVGLDSNGTLPDSDLEHLDSLSGHCPIHVVLNKADLRPRDQVAQVLEQLSALLDEAHISYAGASAYSSESGQELHFERQSLFQTLHQWDRNVAPVANAEQRYMELIAFLCQSVERSRHDRVVTSETLHSLQLDFQELVSHFPAEGVVQAPNQGATFRGLSSSIQKMASAMVGQLLEVESDNRPVSAIELNSRMHQLQDEVGKKLEQLHRLQAGAAGTDDEANLIAQLRHEGLSLLQESLM